MNNGICYKCWEEENRERARNDEWTPAFCVDMGKNIPCKKHKKPKKEKPEG